MVTATAHVFVPILLGLASYMNQNSAAKAEILRRTFLNILGREPYYWEMDQRMVLPTPSYLQLADQFRYWLNLPEALPERIRIVRDAYETYLGLGTYPGDDSGWVTGKMYSADWLKEQFRFYADQ